MWKLSSKVVERLALRDLEVLLLRHKFGGTIECDGHSEAWQLKWPCGSGGFHDRSCTPLDGGEFGRSSGTSCKRNHSRRPTVETPRDISCYHWSQLSRHTSKVALWEMK